MKHLAGIVGILFVAATATAAETAGKAVNVTGHVMVRNEADKIPQMKFLKTGDILKPGAILNTGSVGAAKLLMTDKSIIDMGPSTLFKVDEYQHNSGSDRKVAMSMDYGKIRASVNMPVGDKGKFTLRTKAASMGVRGTEFVVDAGGAENALGKAANRSEGTPSAAAKGAAKAGETKITVVHGKVEVKADNAPAKAQPTMVKSGEQLTTVKTDAKSDARAPAAAPVVVKLSTAELKTVRAEAVQVDKTFTQAVTIDNSGNTGGATLAELAGDIESMIESMPEVDMLPTQGTQMSFLRTVEFVQKDTAVVKVSFK